MRMKRWLSLFLTLVMLLSMIPAAVFAQTAENTVSETADAAAETKSELVQRYQAQGNALWLNSLEIKRNGQVIPLPDWGYELYAWLENELEIALKQDKSVRESLLVNPYADDPELKDGYPADTRYKKKASIYWQTCENLDQLSEEDVRRFAEGVYTAFLQDRPEAFWLNNECSFHIDGNNLGFLIYSPKNATLYDKEGEEYEKDLKGWYITSMKYTEGNLEGEDPVVLVGEIERQIRVFNEAVDDIISRCVCDTEQLQPEQYYNVLHYFYWLLVTQNLYNHYAGTANSYIRKWADLDAWKAISALAGRDGYDGPVCKGYTAALKVLCNRVGIPCVTETGRAKDRPGAGSGEHIWNYIDMRDGKGWYLIDVTWAYGKRDYASVLDSYRTKLPLAPFVSEEADRRFSNAIDGFPYFSSVYNMGGEYEKWFLVGNGNAKVEIEKVEIEKEKIEIDMITELMPVNMAHTGHGLVYVNDTDKNIYKDDFYWKGLEELAVNDYHPVSVEGSLTLKVEEQEELNDADTFGMELTVSASDLQSVEEYGVLVFDHKPFYYNVYTAKQTVVTELDLAGTAQTVSRIRGIDRTYLKNGAQVCVYAKYADGSYVYSNVCTYSDPCGHEYVNGVCTNCKKAETYYLFAEVKQADGTYTPIELSEDQRVFALSENQDDRLAGELTFKYPQECRLSIVTSDGKAHYKTIGPRFVCDTSVALYSEQLRQREADIESGGLIVPADKEVKLQLVELADTYLVLGYECIHVYKDVTLEATCKKEGEKFKKCFKCGAIENKQIIEKIVHVGDESCPDCGSADALYLFGYINGVNVGTQNNVNASGGYQFKDNKLVLPTFTECYTLVKSGDNKAWYIAEEEPTLAEDGASGSMVLKEVTGDTKVPYTLPLPAMSVVELQIEQVDGQMVLRYQVIGQLKQTVNQAPTFEQEGQQVYTCTNGSLEGQTYEIILEKKVHGSIHYDEVASGCVEEGVVHWKCAEADCQDASHKRTVPVKPMGHIFKYVTLKNGDGQYQCLTCKKTMLACCADGVKLDVVSQIAPTCTEPGYTEYRCASCQNVSREETAPVAHSYVDGTCTLCGRDAVATPEITMEYPSLSFEDMIKFNIYCSISDMQDVVSIGLMMSDSAMNGEDTICQADMVAEETDFRTVVEKGRTLYIVSSEGIAPKQLSQTYYFSVFARLSDGSVAYSKTYPYSALRYAISILRNDSNSEGMKNLVVAMLKYATEAQRYFNCYTTFQAEDVLGEAEKEMILAYSEELVNDLPQGSEEKEKAFTKTEGFAYCYPTISFEGAFTINYYSKWTEQSDAFGATLYYWDQNVYESVEVLTPDNASGQVSMSRLSNGEYRGEVAEIAAKYLDRGVYVALVYSDGQTQYCSGVLKYSIGVYAERVAAGTTSQAELAKAVAVYGYYAKELFLKA